MDNHNHQLYRSQSRSDQDERLGPSGPERSQRNPEQFVQGRQSTARALRMQSQQLSTESQVLEDEVLPGTENAYQPAEEISERYDHGKNFTGKIRIELCAKSFILQLYDVLARHRSKCGGQAGSTRHQQGIIRRVRAILHGTDDVSITRAQRSKSTTEVTRVSLR